jgi:pimeloyl-ACP methyl ester carboxylesterase
MRAWLDRLAGHRAGPGVLRVTAGGVLALVLVTAAEVAAQGTVPPTAPAAQRDFAGLVDIGGHRLYLECQGAGRPTVVLVSGWGYGADVWSVDLEQPEANRTMVLPGVAGFTRVCTYERPGTILQVNPDLRPLVKADRIFPSRSDPVPMPRTAQDMVDELDALLRVAGVPGPYVLVGHSLGGFLARLYTSTYSDEVVGLVLVDAAQEETWPQVQALLGPEVWAELTRLSLQRPAGLEEHQAWEQVDLDASVAQGRRARMEQPLRPMPLSVLARGHAQEVPIAEWPLDAAEQMWRGLQDDLASLVPNARYSIATQSGHHIHLQQPALVIEAIRQVVAGVRDRDTWYDLAACCRE